MGRRAKSIKLTSEQRTVLEEGYKKGKATFSRRCQMILLKSENRTSLEVANIVGTNQISVNGWVNRYLAEGIDGLKTKPGRGRKRILDVQKDEKEVKAAVKRERQRLKLAKADLEKDLGKEFSLKTLQRFLKNLSANGNASD